MSMMKLLMKLLDRGQTSEVRGAIALSLCELGPRAKAAIPILIKTLEDDDESLRWAALAALGAIGKPAVPGIIGALGAGDCDMRFGAIMTLARMGADASEAVQALSGMLSNSDERIRWAASEALGSIGYGAKTALVALQAVLSADDEDGCVKRAAERAIKRISMSGRPGDARGGEPVVEGEGPVTEPTS